VTVSILGPRGSYSVQAGALRHRVTIQMQVPGTDSAGGDNPTWKDYAKNVPAAIEDVSGDERISSQQSHGSITTVISIRWRPGLVQSMRVVHSPKGEAQAIYNIRAVQKDTTRRDVVSLMCDTYDSNGFLADGR
jgi:SPP1 family predicted phage head-tail adaptor